MKRKICVMLSLLISLSLCGCRSDVNTAEIRPDDTVTDGAGESAEGEQLPAAERYSATGTGIFLSEEYTVPEDVEVLYRAAAVNDRVVLTGRAVSTPLFSINLYDKSSGHVTRQDINADGIQNIVLGTVTGQTVYLCLEKESGKIFTARCSMESGKSIISDSAVEISGESVSVYIMEQNPENDISLICSSAQKNKNRLYRNICDGETLELKKSEPVSDVLFDDDETSIISVIKDADGGFFVLLERNRGDYCLQHIAADGKVMFSESDEPDYTGGIYTAMYLNDEGNPVITAYDEESEGMYHSDVFDRNTGKTVDRYDYTISGDNIYLYNEPSSTGVSFSYTQGGRTFTFDPDTQTLTRQLNLAKLSGSDGAFCQVLDADESSMLFYSSPDSKFNSADSQYIWITDTRGNVLGKIKNRNAFSHDIAVNGNNIYLADRVNGNLIITVTDTDKMSVDEITVSAEDYPDFRPDRTDVSADGTIILSSWMELMIISSEGRIISSSFNTEKTAGERVITDVAAVGSGYAVLTGGPEGTELLYAEDFTSEPQIQDMEIKNISCFANTYDKTGLYPATSEGILNYLPAESTGSFVMKWADSEISSVPSDCSVCLTAAGKLLWTAFDGNEYRVFLYSEADRETADRIQNKEKLTVACDGTNDFINRAVAEFNRTSPDFRIEIEDYGKYSAGYKDNASCDKLNLDIASGNIPDIVIGGTGIDIMHFRRMGMFADLNQYFENDSDLSKSDFFTNIIESYSSDGKLCCIPLSIFINAVICSENVPGNENSWTFDEFLSADSLFSMTSREDMVKYMITENLSEYVDFSEMKCRFDDIYFSKLLTYIKENAENEDDIMKALSTESGYEEYRNRFITDSCNAELLNLGYADKLTEYSELSSFTLRGMPSSSVNVCPSVSSDSLICISEKSGHRDEAWKFIKLVMSEKYQDTIGDNQKHSLQLSIRKDSFEKMLAQFSDEASQEAADKLRNAVESSNRAVLPDSRITGIVNEQTALFFSDSQTIYETVNNIQNQVRTYLMEIK